MDYAWPPFFDLTTAFHQKRSQLTVARTYGADVTSFAPPPPPLEWRPAYDAAVGAVDAVERALDVLSELHAAPVGASAIHGTSSRADEASAAVTAATSAARARLAELATAVARVRLAEASGAPGLENSLVAKTAQSALATRLSELVGRFRQRQVAFSDTLAAARAGVEEGAAFDVDVGHGLSAAERQQLELVLGVEAEDVQAREAEFKSLARSVETLGAMMTEIAAEVVQQGSVIDQIDVHMQEAVEHTRRGVVHLERANSRAAKTMKRLGILYALGAIILILLMILLHKFS